MDLWQERRATERRRVEPLAVRMRPQSLEEYAGQSHLLGDGKLLRRMLEADCITSLILHGPPGTGKTTLARLIAQHTRRRFVIENAAAVGVKRIREIIEEADRCLTDTGRRTILFLDEIHRFTKSQQDVLLGDVEWGLLTLVGATTENPLFACNSALISRSTLFRLEPLSEGEIAGVVRRAVVDEQRGYGGVEIDLRDEAVALWAAKSDGDARRALNALEVAVLSSGDERPIVIDRRVAIDSIQQKAVVYGDDDHYDSASAMIKSIRGSDPDAALYWVARMLEGGEDPRFIARRLAILASEDIGNADPRAISVAQASWELVERIGMPEARITIAQCVTYLALAPKSNASYLAIDAALADVREGRTLAVPMHLRDPNSSPSAGGDGSGVTNRQRRHDDPSARYRYSHNAAYAESGGVTGQDYLGVVKTYYEPGQAGEEKRLAERLAEIRSLRGLSPGGPS